MVTIDSLMEGFRKHGVSVVTLTRDQQDNLIVAIRQAIQNSSGQLTEATHAHTGQNYMEAANKALKDAEHFAAIHSNVVRLNGR